MRSTGGGSKAKAASAYGSAPVTKEECSDTRADFEKQLAATKDELNEFKARHEAVITQMNGKLGEMQKELARMKEEFSDTRADLEKQFAASKDEAQHEAALTTEKRWSTPVAQQIGSLQDKEEADTTTQNQQKVFKESKEEEGEPEPEAEPEEEGQEENDGDDNDADKEDEDDASTGALLLFCVVRVGWCRRGR